MTKGYKAKSFKGIQVAIEHHADGSVTICKEVLTEIVSNNGVPLSIRALLTPPVRGTMYFLNDKPIQGPTLADMVQWIADDGELARRLRKDHYKTEEEDHE